MPRSPAARAAVSRCEAPRPRANFAPCIAPAEHPDLSPRHPPIMLKNVKFTNYRGFKDFTLRDIARVNLLVGKNGSGKSSVLEGLYLLKASSAEAPMVQVCMKRGDVGYSGDRLLCFVRNMFFSRKFEPGVFFRIAEQSDNAVSVEVRVVRLDQTRNQREKAVLSELSALGVVFAQGYLESQENDNFPGLTFLASLDGIMPFESHPGIVRQEPDPVVRSMLATLDTGTPTSLVPISLLDFDRVRNYFNFVVNNQLEQDITNTLKIIDNKIIDVRMLDNSVPRGNSLFVASYEGVQGRVSLNSLGEGVMLLFRLAVILSASRNGYVFIDDIDEGFHYTVMGDVWKAVLKQARNLNVQVFASTHSADCVEALLDAVENGDFQEDVAIHRIEKGHATSISFSGDLLPSMIAGKVDPR